MGFAKGGEHPLGLSYLSRGQYPGRKVFVFCEFANTDVALVVGANDVVDPRRQSRPAESDLRHASAQRRRGAHRDRAQTQHESGLRKDRK